MAELASVAMHERLRWPTGRRTIGPASECRLTESFHKIAARPIRCVLPPRDRDHPTTAILTPSPPPSQPNFGQLPENTASKKGARTPKRFFRAAAWHARINPVKAGPRLRVPACTGAAWLSSVASVRCRVKSLGRAKPLSLVASDGHPATGYAGCRVGRGL